MITSSFTLLLSFLKSTGKVINFSTYILSTSAFNLVKLIRRINSCSVFKICFSYIIRQINFKLMSPPKGSYDLEKY